MQFWPCSLLFLGLDFSTIRHLAQGELPPWSRSKTSPKKRLPPLVSSLRLIIITSRMMYLSKMIEQSRPAQARLVLTTYFTSASRMASGVS